MTTATPAIQAIEAELSLAIRRDRARRARRGKALRAGGAGVLTLTALSGVALAAGGAFRQVETVTPVGEVELPQDVTIQAVDSYPEFIGRATDSGFTTSSVGPYVARYIYHVTGGEAREIGCGFPQVPTNNIYITSTRPLSEHEIRALLRPDGELEGHAAPPPWITSESNGCPNPGIAGQPGRDDGPLVAGKGAVATPTSPTTRILLRRTVTVPVFSAPGGQTTQPASAPAAGTTGTDNPSGKAPAPDSP